MTEQSKQSLDEAFDSWWYNEGSGIIPLPGNDYEEHGYRISRIAWHNGAYIVLNALHAIKRLSPSLKEQALAELDLLKSDVHVHGLGFDAPAIRRALERLPD